MGRSRPQRRAAALGAAVAILAMLLVAPSSAQQAGAAGPAAAAAAAAAPATAPSAVAPGPLAGDAAVWPAGSIPNWDGPGPIRVCTSEFTPMVYCVDRDPDAYTGYEIELFRKVARIMGWEPGMLQWSCMAWDDMMASLKSRDGRCDIAVAGVEVSPEELGDGIVFTRRSTENGLSVLVKTSQRTAGTWSFMEAFEWQLWVATLGTCVAVALIVWAIDNFYFRYTNLVDAPSNDPLALLTPTEEADEVELRRDHKLERYWWEAISRAMMNRDLTSFTLAGNIIQSAFGILMLLLFTLYLGNTASNLTLLSLSTGGIVGVESLPGLAVGTWTDYEGKLRARGIAPFTYPWDNTADEEAMLELLKSGAIKALVLDSTLMNYISATDCEVAVVGDPFDQFSVATAFPANFSNEALLQRYNAALIALEDSGEDEQLLNAYVTPPDSACGELYSAQVTFSQISGLWILLGISIGVALAWILVVKLWEDAQRRRGKLAWANAQATKAVDAMPKDDSK